MAKIAFLGLGKMGMAVARSLNNKGHELTVWNRSPEKAEALAKEGARAAKTPADAVRGAEIVFTMLADDAATEAVVFGGMAGSEADGAEKPADAGPGMLPAMQRGAIHASLSTISVRLSRRLTASHSERQQHFVGAPVFGRPNVAEQGRLWVAIAGPDNALGIVRPVLEGISRGITVVSDQAWQAHALKLGGNLMITAMIQTLAESFVYARSQGIDPELFLHAVNSALFQSPFYEAYGKTMLHPPEHPGATVELGIKDTRLVREAAADANSRMPLADYLADVLERAVHAGFKDEDWAVGQYRVAEMDATTRNGHA
jgi:3-hydroxyisobutyrate dehydrogenase-like beta-hydroxyacid dehydrogenase